MTGFGGRLISTLSSLTTHQLYNTQFQTNPLYLSFPTYKVRMCMSISNDYKTIGTLVGGLIKSSSSELSRVQEAGTQAKEIHLLFLPSSQTWQETSHYRWAATVLRDLK